jgi:alpha-tubulin suppressor-like RCC1 family protein
VPAGLSNVVRIAAAGSLTLAVTADGAVSAWGGYSQPVAPPQVTNVVSVAAGEDHGLALCADGTVVAWTPDGTIETDAPPGLTNVVMIAAGSGNNLAVTADGTVVAWPDTNIPSGVANVTMVAAGYYHSLAVVKGASPAFHVPLAGPAWGQGGLCFSLPTLSGRVYRPEYKLRLTQTNWTPLPLCYGSGGNLRLTVPATASPQGFYRVRLW